MPDIPIVLAFPTIPASGRFRCTFFPLFFAFVLATVDINIYNTEVLIDL